MTTGNLLTVDWDFFFPRPSEDTEEALTFYDWGHAESMMYISVLWPTRAAAFINADRSLPDVTEDRHGFWKRFRFDSDTKLFVGESHSAAVNPVVADRVTGQVWLLDAHHDCGYDAGDAAQAMVSGRWSCENWLLYYCATLGPENVHMRYPLHRPNAFSEEIDPYADRVFVEALDRRFYSEREDTPVFDTIYLCRSGAWVPPWCDQAFDAWVADTGVDPTWIGQRIERDYDHEAARAQAAQMRQLMAARRSQTKEEEGMS